MWAQVDQKQVSRAHAHSCTLAKVTVFGAHYVAMLEADVQQVTGTMHNHLCSGCCRKSITCCDAVCALSWELSGAKGRFHLVAQPFHGFLCVVWQALGWDFPRTKKVLFIPRALNTGFGARLVTHSLETGLAFIQNFTAWASMSIEADSWSCIKASISSSTGFLFGCVRFRLGFARAFASASVGFFCTFISAPEQ